jgi:hypothetical protein
MSRLSKSAVGALAAGVCLFATALPAEAKSEHVTGGHATVRASMHISAFLSSRGITATPIGPAKVGNGAMTMPMVGGTVTTPTMSGTMDSSGGLEYSKGTKVVRVTDYILKHHGGTVTLTANVNGHRIVIATMSSPDVHMTQTKGTVSRGLHISAVWAKTINQLVGVNVVHTGETIGQLTMTIKMG